MIWGKKSLDMDEMLNDGFSRRFALFYQKLAAEDFKKALWPEELVKWAHSHGFLADKIAAYALNDENVEQYLSDYDYYRLWPLNNPYRIWINDKLTLKYILPHNLFGRYLPKYYFYTEERGCLYCLDCPTERYSQDAAGVLALLKDEKVLAMKLVNGTGSNNFYKLSYENAAVCINSVACSEADFLDFIKKNIHYCITEYLIPHQELAKIHDKIHTLRLMVLNQHGNDPVIVHGYLRFGTNRHGEANHSNAAEDCKANYDFCTQVDVENGTFGNSVLAYADKIVPTPAHPDTHCVASGILPHWDLIKNKVQEMSAYLFEAEYCGFDVGITDDGFKVMEINSHQGIGFLQLFQSLYDIPITRDYFARKLAELDKISEAEKRFRNNIPR